MEQLKQIIWAVTSLVEAVEQAADILKNSNGLGGKFKLLGLFMNYAGELQFLGKIDFAAVKAEILALDSTKQQYLLDEFKRALDLKNDSVESQIESVLGSAEKLASAVREFIALFSKPR